MDYMEEAQALVLKYNRAQIQFQSTAPPRQPPVSQPPLPHMQPIQQQPPQVLPLSAPPQTVYRPQQQSWQQPSTSTDYPPGGWGGFVGPNISGFNTRGLSGYLDPTPTAPLLASSPLSTPELPRPPSRVSSYGDRTTTTTTELVLTSHNIIDEGDDSTPPK